jgi:general stress protein YciG
MPGTRNGGRKAAATNKQRYGDGVTPDAKGVVRPNFYSVIGAIGGKISRGGGFAKNPALAVEAGRKGGKASRRTRAEMAAYVAPRFVDDSEVE